MIPNPRIRSVVYGALMVASLVIGSAQAYMTATAVTVPTWFEGVVAVYAFLAAATGFVAAQHTPRTTQAQDAMEEVDALTTDTEARRFRDDDNDGIPDIKE